MDRDAILKRLANLERKETRVERSMVHLRVAESALRDAMAPYCAKLDAIEEERDELLDQHGTAIAGRCTTCDAILFDGDKGFRCEEGEMFCEEHSPTLADWQDAARSRAHDGDPGAGEELERIKAILANGGALSDTLARPL